MKIIDINELPESVQMDICENLAEMVPFLVEGGYDATDVRDNLLNLVDRVPVSHYQANISDFESQAGKKMVSEAAIKSLGEIRDNLTPQGKELDPVLVSKMDFIDGGHRFELWRRKGLSQFPAVDIHNLVNMDWERYLDDPDMCVPEPDQSSQETRIEAYHGTFWLPGEDEIDENVFFDPDAGYNDFGVVYFSNNVEVARWFSRYNLSHDDQESNALQVVLKGTLSLSSVFRKQSYEFKDHPYLDFDGDESIHIHDRETLYDRLRNDAVSALILAGEYENGNGDDIAVLESGVFNCEAVSLMKPDGSFTDFMDPELAQKIFVRQNNNRVKKEPGMQDVEP